MLFGLRSVIHCEYSISAVRVTYAIDFEHLQWVSVLNLVSTGLRSETSPDHARVSFYLCLRPMNNKDRMTP